MSLLLFFHPLALTTSPVKPALKIELEFPMVGGGGGAWPNLLFGGSGAPATGGWTDVTNDVLTQTAVMIEHGIRGGGPNDRVAAPPKAAFVMNNSEFNSAKKLGYYSLYHA